MDPRLPLDDLAGRLIAPLMRVNVGLVAVDFDGTILRANDAFLALVGHSASAVHEGHLRVWDLSFPEDQELDRQALALIQERGLAGPVERDIRHKSGERIPVEQGGAALPGSNACLVYVLDKRVERQREADLESALLHARLAQAEAEAERSRMALLAEVSERLSSSLDIEDTLVRVASLLVPRVADWCILDLRLLDRDPRRVATHVEPEKEAMLLAISDFLRSLGEGGDDALANEMVKRPVLLDAEFWSRLRAVADEGVVFAIDTLSPRGGVAAPLRARNRFRGVVAFGVSGDRSFGPPDVRLAMQLADRVDFAVDNALLYGEARAAVRARDQLIAHVSHELRNPLNGIVLNARVLTQLQDDGRSSLGEVRALGADITAAARRMATIVQDLLDMARVDEGRLRLELHELVPLSMVEEALRLQRPLAAEKNVEIELIAADDLPTVRGDPRRLGQILTNLLGNAVKFTPSGGHVRVRLDSVPGELRIAIEDDGPGIPHDELGRVFDRFFQGAHGREGAGLGLFITRGMVEAHGGWVRAESEVGRGSTFSLGLPLGGPMEP